MLCSYVHLQKLELPHNKIQGDFFSYANIIFLLYSDIIHKMPYHDVIKAHLFACKYLLSLLGFFINFHNFPQLLDLSCVSHMPYLVVLDASYNEISNFFEFQPPKNLKVTRVVLELTG